MEKGALLLAHKDSTELRQEVSVVHLHTLSTLFYHLIHKCTIEIKVTAQTHPKNVSVIKTIWTLQFLRHAFPVQHNNSKNELASQTLVTLLHIRHSNHVGSTIKNC